MRLAFVVVAVVAACGHSGSAPPAVDGAGADAPPVGAPLVVQPDAYTVPIGRTQFFVAAGATTWTIDEGAGGGAIDAHGLYTAPLVPGTYHVRAADGVHPPGVATVTVADFRLTLVAGQLGGQGRVDAAGDLARFTNPLDVVADLAGKIYVADGTNTIRVLDVATHAVTTLAGQPLGRDVVDGLGAAAQIDAPAGLALDRAHGILYVAEPDDGVVRQIVVATGNVTTLAGTANAFGTLDGVGANARFQYPTGLALDGAGNLFVADYNACTIREIALASKTVTTPYGVAGNCTAGDGTPGAATYNHPTRLVFVPNANAALQRLYVTEPTAVRAIGPISVSTLVGSSTTAGYVDQQGAAARFSTLNGIAYDAPNNRLLVADANNFAIRSISLATPAVVQTVAGGSYGTTDAVGTNARFAFPKGIALDGNQLAWIADSDNSTIRTLDASRMSATIAGRPPHAGYATGDFASAQLAAPFGLALVGNATLYVGGQSDLRALALGPQLVSSVVGSIDSGATDGTGAAAHVNNLGGLALSPAHDVLYAADFGNAQIRAIALPGGAVTTPFSNIHVTTGGYVDAAGIGSRFDGPFDVALVGGTLYVADSDNARIRAIDLASTATTTLAGGVPGDRDGIGTAAKLGEPRALATDGSTHLFFADDSKIKQVDLATAAVTTIAGGGATQTTDGIGGDAGFSSFLVGLAYDATSQSLYAADENTHLIRRIYVPTGAVSTFAGLPAGGVRLESVTSAQLGDPGGIAIASPGKLYFACQSENAVLALEQQP